MTRKRPYRVSRLIGDGFLAPSEPGCITKQEARSHCDLPLSFGEDHEEYRPRRDESSAHRHLVADVTTYLVRLGYSVYPGDVGLRGTYCWADSVALDGKEPLFIECLTKSAIVKYNRHEDKRALAELVPFCFVGEVPSAFLRSLPQTVYGIASPRSSRMIGGEWVPHFYRRGSVRHVFTAQRRCRSILTKIEIGLEGLRLAEDVGSFLSAVLGETISDDGKHRAALADGWKLKWPDTNFGVPFEKHGKPNSTFRITGHDSDLVVRVGCVPVIAELRGAPGALDLMIEWIRDAGFDWSAT